jgi:hypothetical protein
MSDPVDAGATDSGSMPMAMRDSSITTDAGATNTTDAATSPSVEEIQRATACMSRGLKTSIPWEMARAQLTSAWSPPADAPQELEMPVLLFPEGLEMGSLRWIRLATKPGDRVSISLWGEQMTGTEFEFTSTLSVFSGESNQMRPVTKNLYRDVYSDVCVYGAEHAFVADSLTVDIEIKTIFNQRGAAIPGSQDTYISILPSAP